MSAMAMTARRRISASSSFSACVSAGSARSSAISPNAPMTRRRTSTFGSRIAAISASTDVESFSSESADAARVRTVGLWSLSRAATGAVARRSPISASAETTRARTSGSLSFNASINAGTAIALCSSPREEATWRRTPASASLSAADRLSIAWSAALFCAVTPRECEPSSDGLRKIRPAPRKTALVLARVRRNTVSGLIRPPAAKLALRRNRGTVRRRQASPPPQEISYRASCPSANAACRRTLAT
jgi:hypothetical protein